MLLVFKYSAVPLVASRLKSNFFNFCAISITNFLLSLSIEINTVPLDGRILPQACGNILPSKGTVFISIDNDNKKFVIEIAQKLKKLDFNLLATKGTAEYLNTNNIKTKIVNKVKEGNPHVVDSLINNEIQLNFIIN